MTSGRETLPPPESIHPEPPAQENLLEKHMNEIKTWNGSEHEKLKQVILGFLDDRDNGLVIDATEAKDFRNQVANLLSQLPSMGTVSNAETNALKSKLIGEKESLIDFALRTGLISATDISEQAFRAGQRSTNAGVGSAPADAPSVAPVDVAPAIEARTPDMILGELESAKADVEAYNKLRLDPVRQVREYVKTTRLSGVYLSQMEEKAMYREAYAHIKDLRAGMGFPVDRYTAVRNEFEATTGENYSRYLRRMNGDDPGPQPKSKQESIRIMIVDENGENAGVYDTWTTGYVGRGGLSREDALAIMRESEVEVSPGGRRGTIHINSADYGLQVGPDEKSRGEEMGGMRLMKEWNLNRNNPLWSQRRERDRQVASLMAQPTRSNYTVLNGPVRSPEQSGFRTRSPGRIEQRNETPEEWNLRLAREAYDQGKAERGTPYTFEQSQVLRRFIETRNLRNADKSTYKALMDANGNLHLWRRYERGWEHRMVSPYGDDIFIANETDEQFKKAYADLEKAPAPVPNLPPPEPAPTKISRTQPESIPVPLPTSTSVPEPVVSSSLTPGSLSRRDQPESPMVVDLPEATLPRRKTTDMPIPDSSIPVENPQTEEVPEPQSQQRTEPEVTPPENPTPEDLKMFIDTATKMIVDIYTKTLSNEAKVKHFREVVDYIKKNLPLFKNDPSAAELSRQLDELIDQDRTLPPDIQKLEHELEELLPVREQPAPPPEAAPATPEREVALGRMGDVIKKIHVAFEKNENREDMQREFNQLLTQGGSFIPEYLAMLEKQRGTDIFTPISPDQPDVLENTPTTFVLRYKDGTSIKGTKVSDKWTATIDWGFLSLDEALNN